MFFMTHKVIKIGSSLAVTIPAKEVKRQNIKAGDELEELYIAKKQVVNKDDQHILDAAKEILKEYKQDFENLSQR